MSVIGAMKPLRKTAQHLNDIHCERDTCNCYEKSFLILVLNSFRDFFSLISVKECFHCQEQRCKQVGTQDYSRKWQRENNSFLSKFFQTRRRKTKHFTEELLLENGSSLVSRICPILTSVKFLVLVLDIQNATVISTPNVHSYSNEKVIKKTGLPESPVVEHLNSAASPSE